MFLGFQLFEKYFEQPRMVGWCDSEVLAECFTPGQFNPNRLPSSWDANQAKNTTSHRVSQERTDPAEVPSGRVA